MRILRRLFLAFAIAGVLALVAVFILIPPELDRRFNRVSSPAPYQASPEARRLHRKLIVADLHADSLIWGRELLSQSPRGHVDLPRLSQANVALQVFSVPTKVPRVRSQWGTRPDTLNLITLSAIAQLWPIGTWTSLHQRALYLARHLGDVAQDSGGMLKLVHSSEELKSYLDARQAGQVAGLLAIEGLHALDGELENLEELFHAGYRIMGLVHQFDNRLGGSSYGMERGGLTPFGEAVVRRMEELGILVDLAHASPQLIDDVLRVSTRPVLVSHTGVQGTCNRRRNLSDEHVRRIAQAGGLIGIGFWSGATCGRDLAAVLRAIHHAVNLAGVDHVALGSDFDGDSMPFDVTALPQITGGMQRLGFQEEEIRKIMGGNVIRLLAANLP